MCEVYELCVCGFGVGWGGGSWFFTGVAWLECVYYVCFNVCFLAFLEIHSFLFYFSFEFQWIE